MNQNYPLEKIETYLTFYGPIILWQFCLSITLLFFNTYETVTLNFQLSILKLARYASFSLQKKALPKGCKRGKESN